MNKYEQYNYFGLYYCFWCTVENKKQDAELQSIISKLDIDHQSSNPCPQFK